MFVTQTRSETFDPAHNAKLGEIMCFPTVVEFRYYSASFSYLHTDPVKKALDHQLRVTSRPVA